MRMSTKIFIALLGVSLSLSSVIIWLGYQYLKESKTRDFEQRYVGTVAMIGDALGQIERKSELLMENAALFVSLKQGKGRILSTEELVELRDQTGMSHLFVIDRSGNFIRSTNEDPQLIPNLFSFCEDYRKLVEGKSNREATPIIPPTPEPMPYKFLSIPSLDRNSIIEVAVRADFIGATLNRAVQNDMNIESLSLYSPSGVSLGRFGSRSKELGPETQGESLRPGIRYLDDSISVVKQVEATQTYCCQCDKAGLSRDGKYYYLLEATISLKQLRSELHDQLWVFLLGQALAMFVSFFASRFLGIRLGQRFETLNRQIGEIIASNDFTRRLHTNDTNDEISVIAKNVDSLLSLSQRAYQSELKLRENESLVSLARQVSHDIRSPVSALLMGADSIPTNPKEAQAVIKLAADRIIRISNDLLKRNAAFTTRSSQSGLSERGPDVETTMREFVIEKQTELSRCANANIALRIDSLIKGLSFIQGFDLKRILSNIVNNCIEAGPGPYQIDIKVYSEETSFIVVEVQDLGPGFSEDVLNALNAEDVSARVSTKSDGNGLGLSFARQEVLRVGGTIKFQNLSGRGALVTLRVPVIDHSGGQK